MQWWGIDERDGNNDAIHEWLMITAAPCLLYDYIALPQKLYDSFIECRRPLFCFYYTVVDASSPRCACDVPRVRGTLRQSVGGGPPLP
jgi:hypothetical protein